jgi:hypothetical protein
MELNGWFWWELRRQKANRNVENKSMFMRFQMRIGLEATLAILWKSTCPYLSMPEIFVPG